MSNICDKCEDPSWTGQDPIVAPEMPSEGGGGTSNFNSLSNRPKYGGTSMTGDTDIPNIEGIIPSAASSSNQLADKNFVNSSVATNTANFVGTFDSVAALEAVENPSNNDYGFVISTDSAGNTVYNRYKYNADETEWLFEYALNNSSFTAAQWAAIQSGITSGDVAKLAGLENIQGIGEGLHLDDNNILSAEIGKAKILTEDDYNFDSDGDSELDSVALWLLDPGLYAITDCENVVVKTDWTEGEGPNVHLWVNVSVLVTAEDNEDGYVNLYTFGRGPIERYKTNRATGAPQGWAQFWTWEDISNEIIAAKGNVYLTYGVSTWDDFMSAYEQNRLVYCKAGSGNTPATAPYTRQAFMAYVNNDSNPTEVEFQYVRSVSSKSASQQCDQVFVYKLTSAGGGTWTVTTRDMAANVAAGANAERTYSNGTVTINPRLYTTTGQNTNGGITQKLFTDTVGNIESALNAINNGGNS